MPNIADPHTQALRFRCIGPPRGGRVVAETLRVSVSGQRSSSWRSTVDLPAPEGPETITSCPAGEVMVAGRLYKFEATPEA